MEINKQVCSLELAKKLKELGVKQESYFTWYKWDGLGWQIGDTAVLEEQAHAFLEEDIPTNTSAFTVAELGEILPYVFTKDEKFYYIQCNANGNSLRYMDYITYNSNGVGTFLRGYPLVDADTEADARAKMLIYLLENNLISNTK